MLAPNWSRLASADARTRPQHAEIAAELAQHAGSTEILTAHISEAAQHKALLYDRAGEEHYNVISAFIKSMRGSDPDAALYWMTRMVEAGEDPLFIARRMVIFASEDIGNADPRALQIAIAVKDAVDFVGLPEGVIPLAQGVTYLASAPKSNASYIGMHRAREDTRELGALPVPLHLRNAPTPLMKGLGYGKDYRYPHDFEGGVAEQDFLPDQLIGKEYYQPTERGFEARLKEYLGKVREIRAAARAKNRAARKNRAVAPNELADILRIGADPYSMLHRGRRSGRHDAGLSARARGRRSSRARKAC